MKRLFMFLALVLVFSQVSLWAQEGPMVEGFGGFSWLSIGGDGERFNPLGWQASVAGNVTDRFGLVGDFSGNYKDGIRSHFFMGGFRGSARREKVTPFGHVLLGGARFSQTGGSATEFAMGFGGGVDYNASDRISVRVVQFDWLPIKTDSEWETNVIRFGFGIVFKKPR